MRIIINYLLILPIALIWSSISVADPLKVGYIYIGPPGDHGWTYEHDQGRKYSVNKLGDAISTTYLENIPENADAVRAIRKLASSCHELIFTTSFN